MNPDLIKIEIEFLKEDVKMLKTINYVVFFVSILWPLGLIYITKYLF